MEEDRIRYTDKSDYRIITIYGRFCSKTLFKIKKSVEIAVAMGFQNVVFKLDNDVFIDNAALNYLNSLQTELEGKRITLYIVTAKSEKIFPSTIPIYSSIEALNNHLYCRIKVDHRENYVLITVFNDFDINKVPPLREAISPLYSSTHKIIVFNLAEINSISSCGLGLLANVHKKLTKMRGALYLVGAKDLVIETLETTNLLTILPHFTSLAECEKNIRTNTENISHAKKDSG